MIRSLLLQARRRLVAQAALRYAVPAWLVAGIVAVALAVVQPAGWEIAAVTLFLGVTGGAAAWAWWKRPALGEVALRLDHRAATSDRLSTAFVFEEHPPQTPMEKAALEECRAWLKDFNLRPWLPWQTPPRLSWLLFPLIALVALQFYNPVGGRPASPGEADPAALAAAAQLEEMAKALEQRPANETLAKMADALKKSAEKLRSEAEAGEGDDARRAVLRELSAAEEAMKSARQEEAMSELADAMKPMEAQPHAADTIKALEQGNARKAAGEMERLSESLASAQSGEGADSREARMAQLEQAMQDAQKRLGEASRMGQAASQAAEAARRGDTPGAAQAMRQMSQALRESRSGDSQTAQGDPATSEEIQKMLSALQAMKEGGGQGDKGEGEGQQGELAMQPGPGQGNPGEGQGQQGMGDAAAGQAGSELDFGSKAQPFGAEAAPPPPPADLQTQIQGLFGEGESLQTLLPTRGGDAPARTGYRELYEAAAPAAEDAMERENIPIGARLTIKRYFESIRPSR